MKKIIASISIMFMLIFITGCGGMDSKKYANLEPKMDLKEYFNGKIKAWGIIQDRSGNVISRFTVDMVGTWNGDVGTLDEDFIYLDSGKKEKRIWTITKTAENTYEGRAGDIIGIATGNTVGNSMNWVYQMDITNDGSTYRMTLDDWMWVMPDGILVNRSYMKKFGITFAEITIFMQKQK